MANEKRTVCIGVIGVGDFGIHHVETLASLHGVQLFGICDTNKNRLQKVASKFQVDYAYENAEELLQHDELDAVIIATDEKTHEPLTRLAVRYGKHVLLEKPVATDLQVAKGLLQLVEESEPIIMPGHMLRFDSGYYRIKETLRGKEVRSIRVKRNVPIERFALHSRTHPVFMSLIHDIDQIVWNIDHEPKRLYAMERKFDDTYDVPGIFFGLIEFSNGTLCSLETEWCLPNEYGQYLDVEFEAMFEKTGHISYRYPGETMRLIDSGKLLQPDIHLSPNVHGNVTGSLKNELEYFVKRITNETTDDVVTMKDAVRGVAICEALIRSAKEQKEIIWEEL